MKICIAIGLMGLMIVSGCQRAPLKSYNLLEERMVAFEKRLEVIENDLRLARCSMIVPSKEVALEDRATRVAAKKMTRKQIQQGLKKIGYYWGDIDGKMGPKTKDAIQQFQKDAGLKPDGIAGYKTKLELVKALE